MFTILFRNKICLNQIEFHGITDNIAAWIAEWLKDRKQRVVLNGARSELEDVLSGVPQGSVLGPTLFLLFVNDIDTVIASHIQKFADDCKVYRTVHTNAEIAILQEDIKNLCQWSKDWQMVFNVKKCKSLHIGYNNPNHDYIMDKEVLQSVSEESDLGVIILSDLKPSKQCVRAVKKANMTLGMIKRHIVSRDKDTIIKSRKENSQKLTQLSSRSHPRHLVGKRIAQKDTIIDITSDSQVNSNFPYRWSV